MDQIVDESSAIKESHESRHREIFNNQRHAKEKMIKTHEEDLRKLREEKVELLQQYDERQEKELADMEASMVKAKEDHEQANTDNIENLGARKEEISRKLAQKQQDARTLLWQRHEKLKDNLDNKQENRRKALAMSLEEELNVFMSKQEEERSAVVQRQKAEEKLLEERLADDKEEFLNSLAQERTDLDEKQKKQIVDIDQRHVEEQVDLDQKHRMAYQQLLSEFNKARQAFLAAQTASREQHAAEHRAELLQVVEHAQNEFNRILLSKACVLLTAPPAAGKTCLVSQLMMQALDDSHRPFIPCAIRIQKISHLLLLDRREISAVKTRHQHECKALEVAQAAEHVPFDQLDESKVRHKEEKERLESIHSKQMQQAYLRSRFANAWNWVDAYFREEYGVDSETYHLLRTALVSRRLLLLLDGLDEGGAARDEIERHIVEVLAPQGHQILITSRLNLKVELFTRHFEHLELLALSDERQEKLIERRITEKRRADELLDYVRKHVPLDTETGTRMTGNPLMLSMIISLFESMGKGEKMPNTLSELYEKASAIMLKREEPSAAPAPAAAEPKPSDRPSMQPTPAPTPAPIRPGALPTVVESVVSAVSTVVEAVVGAPAAAPAPEPPAAAVSVQQLSELLEAIFFRAHSAQRRLIEEQDVEAAALELGAPEELKTIDWPQYKGRIRIGQVVKLLRGVHSGSHGVLTADARGTLINGKEPRNPFKVTFTDRSNSGWVKDSDFVSSGLDKNAYEARHGSDGRRNAMRAATAKLPAALLDAVRAVRSRVAKDALPLLTMLQSEPLLMQSSHLSFQEFYCARAIHKGMVLPGEPPWRWSAWWANCLRLGIESGEGFGVGLMRAAGAGHGHLNLSGQVGGHRPTSLSAVSELMLGAKTMDLSENSITADEVDAIAKAIKNSKTLTDLSLSKNALGDEGAIAIAAVLPESKLINLNFFGTGMKEEGAKAFAAALAQVPSLTRLNLQYNALRAESKKALELANASRPTPLFLVM